MLSRRRPVPLCGQEGAYVVVAAGQLCSVNGFARKFVSKLFHYFAPAGPRLFRLVVPAQELPNASDPPVSTTYFMSEAFGSSWAGTTRRKRRGQIGRPH